MLENKNDILIFLIICTLNKKLFPSLVKDKNLCFYPVLCYIFCSIHDKSNGVKKNMSIFFFEEDVDFFLNISNTS